MTELGAPSVVKFHAVHRTGKPNVGTRSPSTSNEEEMQEPPRPRPIKLEMFVDDVTAFVRNRRSLEALLCTTDLFSKCYGLEINSEKTECMPLGSRLLVSNGCHFLQKHTN